MPDTPEPYYKHIGLYAYRAGFVKQYLELAASPLEKIESLEQLRVLWHNFQIAMAVAIETPGQGIDTEEDLQKVARLIEKSTISS